MSPQRISSISYCNYVSIFRVAIFVRSSIDFFLNTQFLLNLEVSFLFL